MKVAIVPVGNSRGVRLPKAVLEQLGFGAEAELEIEAGRVVIAPVRAPRRGWVEAFAADPDVETAEDRDWLDAPLTDGDDA